MLHGVDTFAAVEARNAARVFRQDARGLQTFAADYPEAKACPLYRGRVSLPIDGVPCLPCEEFLRRALGTGPGSPGGPPPEQW